MHLCVSCFVFWGLRVLGFRLNRRLAMHKPREQVFRMLGLETPCRSKSRAAILLMI